MVSSKRKVSKNIKSSHSSRKSISSVTYPSSKGKKKGTGESNTIVKKGLIGMSSLEQPTRESIHIATPNLSTRRETY